LNAKSSEERVLYKRLNNGDVDSENNHGGSSRDIMYYIGLDVHKKTISYCVKDASGQVQQEGKVGATRWEVDGWIKTLHNLSMRMGMRRFTRLTNAFSKKVQNHEAMVAIYAVHYNFARIHKTLRITPSMAAGLSDHVWSLEEIVQMADNYMPKPSKRGPYKKRVA